MDFIDCGYGDDPDRFKHYETWNNWIENTNARACFNKEGDFPYGIYKEAVKLTAEDSAITRYVYSLFWGFQVSLLLIHSIFLYLLTVILFVFRDHNFGLGPLQV